VENLRNQAVSPAERLDVHLAGGRAGGPRRRRRTVLWAGRLVAPEAERSLYRLSVRPSATLLAAVECCRIQRSVTERVLV